HPEAARCLLVPADRFSHGRHPGRGQPGVPRKVWSAVAVQTLHGRGDPQRDPGGATRGGAVGVDACRDGGECAQASSAPLPVLLHPEQATYQNMAEDHTFIGVGECHPYREFEGMQPSRSMQTSLASATGVSPWVSTSMRV